MPKPKMPASLETITIAEKLLSEAFGGRVRLNEEDDLGGSNRTQIYRFSVIEGPGDVPATVIVKQAHSTADAIYNPDSDDCDLDGETTLADAVRDPRKNNQGIRTLGGIRGNGEGDCGEAERGLDAR